MKTTNIEGALASLVYDVRHRLAEGWSEEEVVRFAYVRMHSLYKRFALEARYNRNIVLPPPQQLAEIDMEVLLHDTLE